MALTYSTLITENLGDNQVRYVRAYDVPSGVAFNIYVELTVKAPYQEDTRQPIVDEEIFVPDVTVSGLAGLSFTTIDSTALDGGQKRTVRTLTLGGGGNVVEIISSVDYKEGRVTRTMVKKETLYYQPPLIIGP